MEARVRTRLIMSDKISKKQLREFGFLIGFVVPILIGWIIPAINGHSFQIWTLYIGIPFLFLALIKPHTLIRPYKSWLSFGHKLGYLNSHLILGLVFILVLQPTAIIMKIFGYDPLRLNRNNKNSYKENNKTHKVNLERIF